ncbi:gag-Pol polyprotein [Caerostris extrusa]|uniref:Gag-Pol polyprotein n=1 Tax=Caerostris extrusa TaxID=172846 RepID=A0AAV4VVP4_CAEEX|nr:gag-Pol polyprotein [Caerostris extrusa]
MNFVLQIIEEFNKRIGVHPRFSTAGYPASNGIMNRFNEITKQILHHVIRIDPANWNKYIPYLMFAYREVPNYTTSTLQFQLMYGR